MTAQKKTDAAEPNFKSTKLSQQQEAAYQKIQDVAVKAIEGASRVGSFNSLVHTLKEQTKKQASED